LAARTPKATRGYRRRGAQGNIVRIIQAEAGSYARQWTALRIRQRDDDAVMAYLRILERLVELVNRRRKHVRRAAVCQPGFGAAFPEAWNEVGVQFFAVDHTLIVGHKAVICRHGVQSHQVDHTLKAGVVEDGNVEPAVGCRVGLIGGQIAVC